MNHMLSYCKNITNLNLSSFDTKNVTNMSDMFFNCKNLKYLKINKNNNKELLNKLNNNVKIEE